MTDISKKTLEKIKTEKVRPVPRYYFLLKRWVLWSLFGFSILLGSIAGGILIFMLTHLEWDVYRLLGRGLMGFILLAFPYFWLVFLTGFTVFAWYFFRRTEQGYRYKTVRIVLLSIFLSLLGGLALNATQLPKQVENTLQDKIPFYRGLKGHKRRVWMSPEKGLLAGRIISVISREKIQLEDLKGNTWEIDIHRAAWRGRLQPAENLEIKIIGSMESKNRFVAEEIRPWEGKRRQGRRRGGR